MANQRGETTSIGHFYNRCVDAVNNLFDTMSFWTHSKDVEFVDGKTAETKVGAINGITSDMSGEADDIAASIKCVNQLNNSLSNLGGFTPVIDETTGQITGYTTKIGGADTVFPFSKGEMTEFSGNGYRNTTNSIGFSIPIQGMYNRISFYTNHSANSLTVTAYNKDGTSNNASTTTTKKILNLSDECDYISFSGTIASGSFYYTLYNE